MREMTPWSCLVVPSVAKGRGTGHLKRSIALAAALRRMGKEAFLYLDASVPDSFGEKEVVDLFSIDPSLLFSGSPESRSWTLVVLDKFRTSAAEFRRWSAVGPLVGIDEGGKRRASFDYLLDLLPVLPNLPAPNLTASGFLDAPVRRRAQYPRAHFSEKAPLRVLVTFGGEDPAGLSLPAARSLSADPRVSVDLLRGALSVGCRPIDRVRVLDPVPDLKERLADYDLVVTQFGLTAYEAARARVPVLLVAPTGYHQKLARAAGFASAGVGPKASLRVNRWLDRLALLIERTASAASADEPQTEAGEPGTPLARHIASLSFPSGRRCPLCGCERPERSPVLARFPDRTYRLCSSCGLRYLSRANPAPIVYARDYFFADYKKQYGKTYLEDFPSLERAARARVARIAALLKKTARDQTPLQKAPSVLDVGCAYGPFLAASRSEGFSAFGLDPAADAVRFVRDELKIPAVAGLFPDLDPAAAFGVPSFDALGMWYVIEHFTELGAVLEAVSRLVRPGGVFAFSTPSGSGVSARARPLDFLEHSPADHFSIWEPGRTAALLRRYGFRLEKIVVTGHHPERFPGLRSARPGDFLFSQAMVASRLFGLGDTFEAYAVKE